MRQSALSIMLALLLTGMSVGEATGLVLCVEADGRAVLEFSELSGCCSGDEAGDEQHGTADDSVGQADVEGCGPCTDLAPTAPVVTGKQVKRLLSSSDLGSSTAVLPNIATSGVPRVGVTSTTPSALQDTLRSTRIQR